MVSKKNKQCEHIYGFDEGYGYYGDPMEEELPYLGLHPGTYDIQFKYCPLCGVEIETLPKTS